MKRRIIGLGLVAVMGAGLGIHEWRDYDGPSQDRQALCQKVSDRIEDALSEDSHREGGSTYGYVRDGNSRLVPFPFQNDVLNACLDSDSDLLNADASGLYGSAMDDLRGRTTAAFGCWVATRPSLAELDACLARDL